MQALFWLDGTTFTNYFQWKQDANLREIKVMRRYHIQDREDYHKYPFLSYLRHTASLSFIGTINYVDHYVHLYTEYLYFPLRTPSEVTWKPSFCQNSTIWASSTLQQSWVILKINSLLRLFVVEDWRSSCACQKCQRLSVRYVVTEPDSLLPSHFPRS